MTEPKQSLFAGMTYDLKTIQDHLDAIRRTNPDALFCIFKHGETVSVSAFGLSSEFEMLFLSASSLDTFKPFFLMAADNIIGQLEDDEDDDDGEGDLFQ